MMGVLCRQFYQQVSQSLASVALYSIGIAQHLKKSRTAMPIKHTQHLCSQTNFSYLVCFFFERQVCFLGLECLNACKLPCVAVSNSNQCFQFHIFLLYIINLITGKGDVEPIYTSWSNFVVCLQADAYFSIYILPVCTICGGTNRKR